MPELNNFEAVIPGQSLTGPELGAYPWENPPDFPDPDTAFEFIMKGILENDETLFGIVQCLELGIAPDTIVDAVLLNSFMVGQITPDVAILMRQPLTDLILLVAQEGDVEIKRLDEEQVAAKEALALQIMQEPPEAEADRMDEMEPEADEDTTPRGMMAPLPAEPEE